MEPTKRTRRRRRRIAADGAIIGATGAASAFAIDSILQRLPALSSSPLLMAISRVAAGFGLALVADGAGASDDVVNGLVAGPVLVTGVDLGTRLIGSRRPDPPAAGSPELMGQPWAPRLS